MTVWYIAQYLVIVYQCGSYKKYYNHIDRLWVKDPAVGRQLQRTADCATHHLMRYINTEETQIANANRKAKKPNSLRNDRCLKNKVARNNYYNMIYLVLSHNQELHMMQLSFTNPATCSMHLVYFICTNNSVIYVC